MPTPRASAQGHPAITDAATQLARGKAGELLRREAAKLAKRITADDPYVVEALDDEARRNAEAAERNPGTPRRNPIAPEFGTDVVTAALAEALADALRYEVARPALADAMAAADRATGVQNGAAILAGTTRSGLVRRLALVGDRPAGAEGKTSREVIDEAIARRSNKSPRE